jgi:hypothetical protein
MSWRITPTYTPPFPESPSDEDEWTDVNTGLYLGLFVGF